MSMDSTSLPSELLVAPQPLIGFFGLDTIKNPAHKSIWDAFNNNRKTNGAVVQFKLLQPNYEFPISKPKRPSYEWYHPKGILKRNWMLKHLHVMPSVVVLFQDIEWNDNEWSDKQLQCASAIQSLKHNIQERNTRLSLVLVQKTSPLPAGEDNNFASERAASLAAACAISSKMLFILPHTDHLTGYTLRLESAFLEMAQTYYSQMAKQVRSHRDQLTSSHTTLKIRHQFKLGFISEMRSDYNIALKHYSQAYSNLDEIRLIDSICLEIKTVAGFLNYKICRLMFKLKVPRDSINHFLSHIEKYKSRVGFKELLFEHYAWLSTQHSAFAELFCEAINNDLPALQTQHPGIYFHKAAEYTVKRKDAFIQACSLSPAEPQSPTLNSITSPLPSAFFSEYFGIRSLKTGEYSDQQIITLVLDNERNFNHSATIINLLGQARNQFKIYKCLRFCKKISIDMAEEYFKFGDHSNALTLYSLMLSDYRQEKWKSIFSDVLIKTLRCAFLSASVIDFIACSIEALSPAIKYEKNDRIIVLENLWKVFQNVPPVSQSQITPELRSNWEKSLAKFSSPVKIDLDRISDILEGIISFDKPQVKVDEEVNVYFIFRILTDVPLKIKEFNAILTDGSEIYKLKASKFLKFNKLEDIQSNDTNLNNNNNNFVNNLNDFDIKLEPEIYYKMIFTAESNQFLENIQLEVKKIEIVMGTEKSYCILMKIPNYQKLQFKNYNRHKDLIDNIEVHGHTYIIPIFHLNTKIDYGMQSPMLVNEFYKLTCTVTNPHDVFLQNVGVSVIIPNQFMNKIFLTMDLTTSRQKLLPSVQIDIGDLSMQASTKITFYIFSLIETKQLELIKKVWYQFETNRNLKKPIENSPINDDIGPTIVLPNQSLKKKDLTNLIQINYIDDKRLMKTKEEILNIKCNSEFKFVGRYYTLNRKPLTKCYKGENFLFRANIEIQSPCDLDILETYFICDHNLVQSTYSFKRKKNTNTYKNCEIFEDVIVLRTDSTLRNWITQKQFELNKLQCNNNQKASLEKQLAALKSTASDIHLNLNKNSNNMTINNNNNNNNMSNSKTLLSNSITSDDGKLLSKSDNFEIEPKSFSSKLIYHKGIEAIHPTGHLRGFIKNVVMNDNSDNFPTFGLYCIKWRRTGSKDENESKFLISGLDIDVPPLNLYCSIEQRMYLKVPMPLKIVFKNPLNRVQHLVAILHNADFFMCAGHKQLNISVYPYCEKELVFNLYPLKVGWLTLPELNLEYNTQIDSSKNDDDKKILSELVQRSMPKKVFILPAIK